MWLGHPDPATALLEQVRHDPDGDALSGLMTEWYAVFGSTLDDPSQGCCRGSL
jgi:hypothetical protein